MKLTKPNNRSSDPSLMIRMRSIQFGELLSRPTPLASRPSPLTPAGRAGHSSSSTGGVEPKKTFEFPDRISYLTRCLSLPLDWLPATLLCVSSAVRLFDVVGRLVGAGQSLSF